MKALGRRLEALKQRESANSLCVAIQRFPGETFHQAVARIGTNPDLFVRFIWSELNCMAHDDLVALREALESAQMMEVSP